MITRLRRPDVTSILLPYTYHCGPCMRSRSSNNLSRSRCRDSDYSRARSRALRDGRDGLTVNSDDLGGCQSDHNNGGYLDSLRCWSDRLSTIETWSAYRVLIAFSDLGRADCRKQKHTEPELARLTQ